MSRSDRKKERAERREARRERRKKDPMYLEARKVLLNQIELDSDGHFITTEQLRIPLWGAADGENRTRFLGVSRAAYFYTSKLDHTKAVFRAGKAMGNIGRGINLRCRRDAVACLVKTYIFYPVVLIFYENEDDQLTLAGYTPRTFSAAFALRLSIRKFEKAAEDILEKSGSEPGVRDKLREKRYRRRNAKYSDEDYKNPDDEITEDDLIPEDDSKSGSSKDKNIKKEKEEEPEPADATEDDTYEPFDSDEFEWASDDEEIQSIDEN